MNSLNKELPRYIYKHHSLEKQVSTVEEQKYHDGKLAVRHLGVVVILKVHAVFTFV